MRTNQRTSLASAVVLALSGIVGTAAAQTDKKDDDEEEHMSEGAVSLSAEFYDLLCQYCRGEALQIIRNVPDGDGFQACPYKHLREPALRSRFRKRRPDTP